MTHATLRLLDLAGYAREILDAAHSISSFQFERRQYQAANIILELCHCDPDLADLCERGLFKATARTASSSVRVYALNPTMAGCPKVKIPQFESGYSASQFDAHFADHNLRAFFHSETMSWQIFDPATATGVILMVQPATVPLWESGSPLRLFWHWRLAQTCSRLIHAGTLGTSTRGILLAGSGGSGKSGTVMSGILNGLKTVGDDYIAVSHAETINALPVFRNVKQDAEGLKRLGVNSELCGDLNWQGKFEFDPSILRADLWSYGQAMQCLVFPNVARERHSRLRKIKSHEAALRLSPSSILQMPGDRHSNFQFIADLVRKLPAYELDLSEDPVEIVETLATLVNKDPFP